MIRPLSSRSRRFSMLAAASAFVVGLAAAAAMAGQAPVSKMPAAKSTATTKDPAIEAILKKMSVQDKVGQILFLGFGGTEMDETIIGFLKDKRPGGLAFFKHNIKSLPQTLKLIRDVRTHDPLGVPMFLSVDQEGANVVRLTKMATVVPSNMAIGATDSEADSKAIGAALGRDLLHMGFNMNLAPVLDVASNPKNPVIGIRSFGEDPARVAALGAAYIDGLQEAGVSAVAKHFPGHGDTATDSHFTLPRLDHDRARLDAVELRPFREAVEHGLDAIMTAHIALSQVAEKPDVPATVSQKVLTGILRDEWGYQGLIITDGLEMQGIVDLYGSGEAAVRAVEAGADMLLILWTREKKTEVQQALMAAVKSGRLTEARLDESVRRILSVKKRRGLFAEKMLPVDAALAKLKASKHRRVVGKIAREAVTVVKNADGVLPLKKGQKVVVASTEPTFMKAIAKELGAESHRLRLAPGKKTRAVMQKKLLAATKGKDVLVVGLLNGDWAKMVAAVQKARPKLKVVVVSFGSPYLLSAFPSVEGYVCAYAFRWASEKGAAAVVLGKTRATGKLPVTLPTGQPRGTSLSLDSAQ